MIKYSKIFILSFLIVSFAFSVEQASLFDVGTTDNQNPATSNAQNIQNLSQNATQTQTEVFEQNLFSGNFTMVSQHIYNPDYILAIGDVVNVKLCGAYEFEQSLIIDSQGNIFLPQVGTIKLLGVKNSNLVGAITRSVKKVFKNNVQVYADMGVYQNVSVFVTGNVNKPGLYKGLSSDSLIQFIDKAAGINPAYGSFRKIAILRNNKPYKHVDLYDFMVNGKIEMFALKNGDVILVDSVGAYVSANDEVLRPYRFEAKNSTMSLAELAKLAGTKPMITSAVVRSHTLDSKIIMKSYPVIVISANGKAEKYRASSSATIHQGDSILVLPKVETKTLQATSLITQILYQRAIAATVVLDI